MKKIIKTKDIDLNTMFIIIETENNYFSITCDVYFKDKAIKDKNFIYGGCAHNEILEVRPDLKILTDLHLSNLDGIPMHFIVNGFYFYEIINGTAAYHEKGDNDFEKYSKILSKHLRIDLNECFDLIEKLNSIDSKELKYIEFSKFCSNQIERYNLEAKKAVKFIDNIPNYHLTFKL